MKKGIAVIVITILYTSFLLEPPAETISLAQPGGGQYTIYINVTLNSTPISGATVVVTNTANGDNDITQKDGGTIIDYGNGWYGINLANKISWQYGDLVLIEAYYSKYYGSNTTILTKEGMEYGDIVYVTLALSQNYTLTYSVNPPGSGNITLDPPGGVYPAGTIVTATAYANAGYNFSHWSGDASGTNATINILMNENKSIIANFNALPNKPSKPIGPSSGYTNTSYTFETSTTDPDGDDLYYLFDWGDGSNSGWIGPYSSGSTASASHSWNEPGTYEVKVKAKDVLGLQSEWSDSITVTMGNHAPNKPSEPSGPTSGYTNISYTFETSAMDEDGDRIKYGWDWNNDGVVDEWTTWYNSGDTCSISHSWNEPGTYEIKVKAKDEYGATSDWSNATTIDIRENDTIPPDISLEVGTPSFNNWISSTTPIYINASDAHDYTIHYRVWNGSWQGWQTGLLNNNIILHIQDEGLHYIEYYATDSLNNTSPLSNATFYVDNSPPIITKEYSSPSIGVEINNEEVHIVRNNTLIYLNATDLPEGSSVGIYKIFWSFDGINWSNETFDASNTAYLTVTLNNLEEGLHSFYYYATDMLNQQSQIFLQKFIIDNSPPTSRVADIIPWEIKETPFNIIIVDVRDNGYDGGAGVCKVEVYYNYSNDNFTSSWTGWILYDTYYVPWALRNDVPNWTLSFDAPYGSGWYRFKSIAYDCLSNVEQLLGYDAWCRINFSVYIEIGEPKYIDEMDRMWISPSTPIYINDTYDIYYRIYNNGSWMPLPGSGAGIENKYYEYNGFFNLSMHNCKDGKCIIEFYRNGSDIKNVTLYMDSSPPSTLISSLFFISPPLILSCNASDEGSGIKYVEFYYQYSYDNITWSNWTPLSVDDSFPYKFNFSLTDAGFYRIATIGIDNVENMEVLIIKDIVRIFYPDINEDGEINIQDLVILAKNFNGDDAYFDINGDRDIDTIDASIFLELWWK